MVRSCLTFGVAAAILSFGSRYQAYAASIRDHRLSGTRLANASCPATSFQVGESPYESYFLSDCHSAAQVVVTSEISVGDALDNTNARVVVAWPAGNSGVVAYFGGAAANESVKVDVLNSTSGKPLEPIYHPATTSQNASYGVSVQMSFNVSTNMNLATLGSIRTIRDGPGNIHPELQVMDYTTGADGSVTISRLWLDNVTTTYLSFTPVSGGSIALADGTDTPLMFDAGTYLLNASFDYPQLEPMTAERVFLDGLYEDLSTEEPEQVNGLQFLSYTTKLLAGGWHYLTYFGRDSMLSALLLQPVLSQGNSSAMEAVIGAAIDRLNYTDGSTCHEETIGDYATWTNMQMGVTSTAPGCTYVMIDTDYYLPILMSEYFVSSPTGADRTADFLGTHASFFPAEANLTYGDKALSNAKRVMSLAAPFAATGGQIIDNLLQLKEGQSVGQWRDSNTGLGGGRIPFDVNTALMPAALRAIGKLARAGVYDNSSWETLADEYAVVWETSTLQFFEITVPEDEAKQRVQTYAETSSFAGPSQSDSIDGDVDFYALALTNTSVDANDQPFKVETMHSDTSFRLLLVNDTDNAQLTRFLNNTAKSVISTFPAGLLTDVGMLVANPAYGSGDLNYYDTTWTNSAYHGTVVWSFQLAMMARGFELQLSRCNGNNDNSTYTTQQPAFCRDATVYANVKKAYNSLWDTIDANKQHLTSELWSWTYSTDAGAFEFLDYGLAASGDEGDAVQLWSLTFLAVKRNMAFV